MDSINIDTGGFKELDRMLKELPKNVQNRVLQRSTVAAMRKALPIVRAAAPDGEPRNKNRQHFTAKAAADYQRKLQYGKLKDNIKRVKPKKNRTKTSRGAVLDTGNAFWGFFLEFGWRGNPAQPWFVPAFKSATGVVLNELKARLGKGIEDEAKKLL